MSAIPAEDNFMRHERGDVYQLYEIICLLSSMDVVRGNRIKHHHSNEEDGSSITKTRHDFADAVAYICAFKKDPGMVTAVALGIRDSKVVIWIAANKNVRKEVEGFLNNLARLLHQVACDETLHVNTDSTKRRIADLAKMVIKFNRHKIRAYYKFFLGKWKETRDTPNSPDVVNQWVQNHFYNPQGEILEDDDMSELAFMCHDARKGVVSETLKKYSSQRNKQGQVYEQLYKLLFKLGKHVTMSRKLLDATLRLRYDFRNGILVHSIPASTEKLIPCTNGTWNLSGIASHIFPDNKQRLNFIDYLRKFYDLENITEQLADYKAKTKTRVHAEILLINHFEKTNSKFLDDTDRYIGCSKPACYLCYHYISSHPDRYVLPHSHQKLYPAWRLPDIRETEPRASVRFNQQKIILSQLSERLLAHLFHDFENQQGPRPFHADSTAGKTSTICAFKTSIQGMNFSPFLADIQNPDFSLPNFLHHGREQFTNADDEEGGVRLG